MTNGKQVEFFFDVGSPYAYLASTQIDALAARRGAAVVWRPFLLGGVFKAAGNDMPARVPAKAKWMLSDLAEWAALYGVPFSFPPIFPANSLRAMRACAFAEARGALPPFAKSLFTAYWTRGLDPSGDEAISEAARAAGLDPSEVKAGAEAQEVKDALRASTEEAVRRGAFGAPTIFLGERMFWGNDRLPLLERALEKT